MNPWTVVGLVIVAAVLLYIWWNQGTSDQVSEYKIVTGSQPGDTQKTIPKTLPRSFNQPEGLIFSYACWILVKDFGKGYGQQRRIFSRGDTPGVYLDGTTNSLLIKLEMFDGTEVLSVPNIPALKWVHLAIVVDQTAVDIYINGTLREHKTLVRVPKQTESPILLGPGWDGVLARLSYWPRALSATDVQSLAQAEAPDDLMRKPGVPQYFDLTWYIGRLYSTE